MQKLKLPKIGLRNLKTALAVFICMIIFKFFNFSGLFSNDVAAINSPFYACIAAVICMKDTVESTFSMGKNRLIGTLLGGIIGIITIYIMDCIPLLQNVNPIVSGVGIIIAIYCCNIINKPGAVTICCIVFIGIMVNYNGPESYFYALGRSIDTAIGIIVAILINKYINPPTSKVESSNDLLDYSNENSITELKNEIQKLNLKILELEKESK